jgi:nitroimidazol reductase NimA-like FMN-containing flavoprotein (pyridoxamine 5'-phosphate oxidase superfamily)
MRGELSSDEIEELLRSETIGRIGCHARGMNYVVPVTYVFYDGCVYGHSSPGRKIRIMRANPAVCFEIDRVVHVGDWMSVIAWGTYEELTGEESLSAMNLLIERLRKDLRGSEHPSYVLRTIASSPPDPDSEWIVLYRIRLTKVKGRFERP